MTAVVIGANRDVQRAAAEAISAAHELDRLLADARFDGAARSGREAMADAALACNAAAARICTRLDAVFADLRAAVLRRQQAAGVRIDPRVGKIFDAAVALGTAGDDACAALGATYKTFRVLDPGDALGARRAAVAARDEIAAARAALAAALAGFVVVMEADHAAAF